MLAPLTPLVKLTLRAVPHQAPIDRFNAQYVTEPNCGCWIWVGARVGGVSNLRPRLMIDGKNVSAYRFAYSSFVGDIPAGLIVRHKCHNGLCVNPDHLVLGTHQDNTNDMLRAGRHFSQNGNYAAMEALKARVSEISKRRSVRPACARGHLLDERNLVEGKYRKRICRECRKMHKHNYRLRLKEKTNAVA